LKGLSIGVESKMLDCSIGCPFPDAKMFADYYGQADYGDKWIMAAFEGGATSFSNGNANFSSYEYAGRNEVIKKGSVYMNVFMYVIQKFEDAVINCNPEQNNTFNTANMWDKGVAFYSGSMEGTDGLSTGNMLHQLADELCQSFNMCGIHDNITSTDTSYVNHELLQLFKYGRNHLLISACDAAEKTLRSITKLMYVPLIQGTLRSAHILGSTIHPRIVGNGEKEKAEGAIFAASVLPRIHAANASAANIIFDNMKVGALSTSFADVKTAFESVYSDLDISCLRVGVLVDSNGEYYEDAGGCPSESPSMPPSTELTMPSSKELTMPPTESLSRLSEKPSRADPTVIGLRVSVIIFFVFLGLLILVYFVKT